MRPCQKAMLFVWQSDSMPANKPARPPKRGSRWTSFVADDSFQGRAARGLHEEANPSHRLRVEHDSYTLLIHLSDEGGTGWTTIAIDRATRQSAIVHGTTQSETSRDAYESLYGTPGAS